MGVATLSMSSVEFAADCRDVVAHMRMLGIQGDVTCNTTVIDGDVERGCRARIASSTPRDDARALWERLSSAYKLTCAHISIDHDRFSGCVLDAFRASM